MPAAQGVQLPRLERPPTSCRDTLTAYRSLDGDQVYRSDVGIVCEQFRRGCRERLGDLARVVRLTARFGLNRVEDPVGDLIDAARRPWRSAAQAPQAARWAAMPG